MDSKNNNTFIAHVDEGYSNFEDSVWRYLGEHFQTDSNFDYSEYLLLFLRAGCYVEASRLKSIEAPDRFQGFEGYKISHPFGPEGFIRNLEFLFMEAHPWGDDASIAQKRDELLKWEREQEEGQ
jgi:hypothetical protein